MGYSASSSTEDAVNQLRSKRPMSRTEVPSDSTDKQCNSEDEGTTAEHIPSSSKMINFEFSNGHPYQTSSADDHEYVEYRLQHVEGYPCNVEEEERVSFVWQNGQVVQTGRVTGPGQNWCSYGEKKTSKS